MTFDYIESESYEFMTQAEIVNDILSKLHYKDRVLLELSNRSDLQLKFPEWGNHIRNFYLLSRKDNPVSLGIDVDSVVLRIMEAVWDVTQKHKLTGPQSA